MELSTGREIGTFFDVVGINDDGRVYEGFSNRLLEFDRFSREEKLEIVDMMIRRWQTLREKVAAGVRP